MPTLRLTQHHIKDHDYRIDLTFDQYHTATVDLTFDLPPDEQERIRWYLEDYLENPSDPHPKMATRIEQKMRKIGVELFETIFEANRSADRLWGKLYDELRNTRMEIITGVQEAEVMQGGLESFSTPKSPSRSGGWNFLNKTYKHTSHAFGYIAPFEAGQKDLQPAGNMAAQEDLKNQPITITLQRLRVKDYPGGGTHHILFDFYARNQVQGDMEEELHFNAAYRAREGEEVAVMGYPIFVGLNVGAQGVAFRCFTVNVKNEGDEAFLGFLDSGVFKAGLKLAATAQPALKPFSEMAQGMTRAIASRHKNVPMQDFYLGLDFTNTPSGARLAEGAYVTVQNPGSPPWDWDAYAYNPNSGQIIDRDDNSLLPYNYVVFGVSRYAGE